MVEITTVHNFDDWRSEKFSICCYVLIKVFEIINYISNIMREIVKVG